MPPSKDVALELLRQGQARVAHGDLPGALALYDQAFKADLTNVAVLRELGLLCLRMGDLDRAQKTFRALLLQRLDPADGITKADVYFHLGDLHSRQGDRAKAIAMLTRAIETDAQHEPARALLARLQP